MNNFKVGDRVIIIKDIPNFYNFEACRITEVKGEICHFTTNYYNNGGIRRKYLDLIHEKVYNSPLYKAMSEKEWMNLDFGLCGEA